MERQAPTTHSADNSSTIIWVQLPGLRRRGYLAIYFWQAGGAAAMLQPAPACGSVSFGLFSRLSLLAAPASGFQH
eukprot:CAMPEP_0204381604 /NCGR_PEP_ID=MMETSP0469-20131031/54373_1 /ASSEMBLY_ACC=CAM_ASM_000384 /TAXON_ID=2969 /ORGANISM="Oxyrrhis marina" /LENGTH=74 /DNA_ID=CAMNT_0051373479 /DNA_START=1 /DNA_END=222 /DNA_ORIENTATION=+